MFALPLVSSGTWFSWAALGLLAVCVFTYLAATLLIEVNVKYPIGSSFDTLIRRTLGDRWAAVNNISIAFIMFILMYAYITAGAGILTKSLVSTMDLGFEVPQAILSTVFASVIAILIWFGTSLVSRVSTVLMVAMCVTFAMANSGLLASLSLSDLVGVDSGSIRYLWSALPVFVTAFACAGLVPSLSAHYDNQTNKISQSVLLGLGLVLLVYLVWLASTLGNITKDDFLDVSNNGGGLSALVVSLQDRTDSELIDSSLTWFSHFAVITSFISIGLGLAHFLVDRFKLAVSAVGRTQAVVLAFSPPLIASLLAPYGFVSAIAYAGVFVAFSFFIIPALMYRKIAQQDLTLASYPWIMVLIFGVLIMILKLMNSLTFLPKYV